MAATVLQADDLSYAYPDGKQALRSVSFQVERGAKLFFHGANGAGKTTLFQCLNGLLRVKRGTIRLHDDVVPKESDRMKRIGIVFQNAADQIVSGSVYDEIAFGPLNQGLSIDIVAQRVEAALRLLDIEALRDRPPHFLSYGEKKRVAIASVLSMERDILLLDEPTSGLDARQQEELADILDRLAEEGKTLLVSTHDADFSFRLADRVIVLYEGRLVAEGSAEDVFSQPEILSKAGLVKPVLMRVYEQLLEYSYIEGCRIPKTVDELSGVLQRSMP